MEVKISMSQRKIPLRKCVACHERKEKKDLVRLVHDKEKGILLDDTGKANGRGAYLCRNEACVLAAKKKNILKNALKVSISDEIYEEILQYVKK